MPRILLLVLLPLLAQGNSTGQGYEGDNGHAETRRMFQVENSLTGEPELSCREDGLMIELSTAEPFLGNVYVKGNYNQKDCRISSTPVRFTKSVKMKLDFDACGLKKETSDIPPGSYVSAMVIVMFHPKFLTKADQAFEFRCFYSSRGNKVRAQIAVSMVSPRVIEDQINMPICSYEVLHGGPGGKSVKSATIGDHVYHKWSCDRADANLCMRVHSCYVDDGKGDRAMLINQPGCAVDKLLLGDIEYLGDLVAGRNSYVFGYADKPILRFECQIAIFSKHNGKCERPLCSKPIGQAYGNGRSKPRTEKSLDGSPLEKATAKEKTRKITRKPTVNGKKNGKGKGHRPSSRLSGKQASKTGKQAKTNSRPRGPRPNKRTKPPTTTMMTTTTTAATPGFQTISRPGEFPSTAGTPAPPTQTDTQTTTLKPKTKAPKSETTRPMLAPPNVEEKLSGITAHNQTNRTNSDVEPQGVVTQASIAMKFSGHPEKSPVAEAKIPKPISQTTTITNSSTSAQKTAEKILAILVSKPKTTTESNGPTPATTTLPNIFAGISLSPGLLLADDLQSLPVIRDNPVQYNPRRRIRVYSNPDDPYYPYFPDRYRNPRSINTDDVIDETVNSDEAFDTADGIDETDAMDQLIDTDEVVNLMDNADGVVDQAIDGNDVIVIDSSDVIDLITVSTETITVLDGKEQRDHGIDESTVCVPADIFFGVVCWTAAVLITSVGFFVAAFWKFGNQRVPKLELMD